MISEANKKSEAYVEILKSIPTEEIVRYLENHGVVHFLDKEFTTDSSSMIKVEKLTYATDIRKIDGIECPVGSEVITRKTIDKSHLNMRVCLIKE